MRFVKYFQPLSVAIAVVIACGAGAGTGAQEPQQQASNKSKSHQLLVKILDEDGKPLRDAKCSVSAGTKKGRIKIEKTNQGPGLFELRVPDNTYYLSITVKASKHTPMISRWRWQTPDAKKELPPEIVFPMKKGVAISGTVRDEQGNIVPAATVRLLAIVPDKRGSKPYPSLYDHAVKTNDKGIWTCDLLPESMTDVWLRFEHSDFVSDDYFGQTSTGISVEQLVEGTLVSILKKGKTVVGTVVDPDGKPVVGAKIHQGSDRMGSHFPTTKTDDKGIFRFPNSRAGEMILTIYSKGFAPELLEINVAPNMRAARVKLKKGRRLSLKIVDSNGKPLANTMVFPDTWREHRSLCDFSIPRKTDKNGEYVWNDAPSDEVQYDILLQGYLDARNTKLVPTDKQQIVTLSNVLKITGKVTDSETGEPIKSFTVIRGFNPINWQADATRSGKNGRYEFVFDYPRPGHYLRFDAIGYKSEVSRKFTDDEGSVTFDVKLQPAKPVEGTVVDANDKPVANAYVVINSPGERAVIENGRIGDRRDVTFVTTDDTGRFVLPSRDDKAAIVVLHDAGMKMIECAAHNGGKLKLVPWATIKGKVTQDGKPVEQQQIRFYHTIGTETEFAFSGKTTTDDEGNYTLPRVPPNESFVISTQTPQGQLNLTLSVETKPGKVINGDLSE